MHHCVLHFWSNIGFVAGRNPTNFVGFMVNIVKEVTVWIYPVKESLVKSFLEARQRGGDKCPSQKETFVM